MSYLAFLAVFVALPCAVLAGVAWRRRQLGDRFGPSLAGVCSLAIASALPWDGAAIRRGYWFFAPDRLLGPRLWVVPVEEVSFFVLESVLLSLTLTLLLPGAPPRRDEGRQ